MVNDLITFMSTIDFSGLIIAVKALYYDILSLVGILKGSSTAAITSSSL